MRTLPIALSLACATLVHGAAGAQVYSADTRMMRVQVCIPDARAVVEERTIDASSVPEGLPEQDWQDMLLRATAVGRREGAESAPRALVVVRAARPLDGTGAAKTSIAIGHVSVGKHVLSSGGGGVTLSDATEKDQAIYDRQSLELPGDLRAVNVEQDVGQPGNPRRVRFWFQPPKRIPTSAFTQWELPVFQEDAGNLRFPGTREMLFEGKALPTSTIDRGAPRVRYSYRAIDENSKDGRRRVQAFRALSLGHATSENRVVSGPAIVKTTIPGC